MQIRNVNDCFKERLLRKINPDIEKSKKSMQQATLRIKRAKEALTAKYFHIVLIESYTAMFHAARAVLYKDGIQEKSHYAISVYLKEKYAKTVPLPTLNLLDIHRNERHEALYGLEYTPEKNEAQIALTDAHEFIRAIKTIV